MQNWQSDWWCCLSPSDCCMPSSVLPPLSITFRKSINLQQGAGQKPGGGSQSCGGGEAQPGGIKRDLPSIHGDQSQYRDLSAGPGRQDTLLLGDPGKVKRQHVSLGPLLAFLEGAEEYPLLGDDPRSHDGQKAFSVTPVPTTDHPEGYLYVVLRGEEFDSVDKMIRESYFLRLSGWAVVVSLGLGLLVGLIVLRLLTRRLHRLSNLMADFHQSNFISHQPICWHRHDRAMKWTSSVSPLIRWPNTFSSSSSNSRSRTACDANWWRRFRMT